MRPVNANNRAEPILENLDRSHSHYNFCLHKLLYFLIFSVARDESQNMYVLAQQILGQDVRSEMGSGSR